MVKADHVTFMALDPARNTNATGFAKACRSALATTKGNDLNTHFDHHSINADHVFTIRWRDIKGARLFEGTLVRFHSKRFRAQAYPDAPPQMFVAHMNHISENGIRVDAVHAAIAHAVPDVAFHLRHEKIDRSNDTVWIVVFQTAPQLLRFEVGIQTKIDDHRVVAFEPLMKAAACPVCRQAHSAVDCELLERAGKVELGLEKGSKSFLSKMPELA